MPFPNQRNFEPALERLGIDRSGRGLPLLEGVQTVYNDSIEQIVEPIRIARRYGRYQDAAVVGRISIIEFEAPANQGIAIEFIKTDSTAIATPMAVSTVTAITGGLLVFLNAATGFITGGPSNAEVRSGDYAGVVPPFIADALGAIYSPGSFALGGGGKNPLVYVAPGNIFAIAGQAANTALDIKVVFREYPPNFP